MRASLNFVIILLPLCFISSGAHDCPEGFVRNHGRTACSILAGHSNNFCDANQMCLDLSFQQEDGRMELYLVGRNAESLANEFKTKKIWSSVNNFAQADGYPLWLDAESTLYESLSNVTNSTVGKIYKGMMGALFVYSNGTRLIDVNPFGSLSVYCELSYYARPLKMIKHKRFIKEKAIFLDKRYRKKNKIYGCPQDRSANTLLYCLFRCTSTERCIVAYYNAKMNHCVIMIHYDASLNLDVYPSSVNDWMRYIRRAN